MTNTNTKTKAPTKTATKAKPQAKAVGAGRKAKASVPDLAPRPASRSETMIALMRVEGGTTAQALAEAVGWQLHSVRGFISGTLKKRADLTVATERVHGVTRYSVADVAVAGQ